MFEYDTTPGSNGNVSGLSQGLGPIARDSPSAKSKGSLRGLDTAV